MLSKLPQVESQMLSDCSLKGTPASVQGSWDCNGALERALDWKSGGLPSFQATLPWRKDNLRTTKASQLYPHILSRVWRVQWHSVCESTLQTESHSTRRTGYCQVSVKGHISCKGQKTIGLAEKFIWIFSIRCYRKSWMNTLTNPLQFLGRIWPTACFHE